MGIGQYTQYYNLNKKTHLLEIHDTLNKLVFLYPLAYGKRQNVAHLWLTRKNLYVTIVVKIV